MRAGRDEEFSAYVTERRAAMVRTALALTGGDAHLAEDLVQTTLTRLYVAWPAFQRARTPAAYVRRALLNALIDEERRPWRRRERTTSEVPETLAPDGAGAGGGAVEQALAELPARMRAAVVFRYLEDLSVAETADLLGCTRGTVKSQCARALDKLRERLGAPLTLPDDEPDDGPDDERDDEREKTPPRAGRARHSSANVFDLRTAELTGSI